MTTATLWAPLAYGLIALAAAEQRPGSLVRNGGCESSTAWSFAGGAWAAGGNPGQCLRIAGQGSAAQEVLVARRELVLTAGVDVRVAGVKAHAGQPGYAFAAVYQTDDTGRLVASHDFVQLVGTEGWQRRSTTFRVHPEADYVSLRCGLFQAEGEARFDNWTLVPGDEGKRLDEVAEPGGRPPRPGVAAILQQPDLPAGGAPASPEMIAAILQGAGLETHLLAADELADPTVFNPSRFDLLVLPTGPTFPAAARLATVEFLRQGGSFLSVGGYAFNQLVRQVDGRWVDEQQVVQRQLDEALQRGRSRLPDGGFEDSDPPVGGSALDGAWRRSGERCRLVAEDAHDGTRCAEVSAPPGSPPGDVFWAELPCESGRTYRITGWMRTREVTGQGMAYMAVYQHDAAGGLVEFRDFAVARGTTDWQAFTYDFTPPPRTVRLRIPLGLYQANGTAWFDDVRLGDLTGVGFRPLNTATGKPADGLEVAPAQIGVFDASFPLQRVQSIRTAAGQHVTSRAVELNGEFRGWAASGVIGHDRARWIPLWTACDRYGRPRGAAGALVVNYGGFYSGSCWAYFGVENVDLFRDPAAAAALSLQDVARFLVRRVWLRNLTTDRRLYRPGESAAVSLTVDNRGGSTHAGEVVLSVRPIEPAAASDWANSRPSRLQLRQSLTVTPGARVLEFAVPSEVLWPAADKAPAGGLWQVTAELRLDGQAVDQLDVGLVCEQPAAMRSGPELRFQNNYFTLDGRPQFLFGSDTYHSIYDSDSESPLTWAAELSAARDLGLDLYENLQYTKPGHVFGEEDWRGFRALAQLTQQLGLVFMPGMLIGHNVAVGDEALAEQRALCRQYAERFRDVPGLLYYINGDYQLNTAEHPQDVLPLWNRWLAERYGTADRLRAAWGGDAVRGEWGKLAFPPPNSGRWDDAAALDASRFERWLMRRWNETHVAAVREHDRDRPITSEYYQQPGGGIDLIDTIDGQDVSNIGFFDRPGADLDNLPLQIRWNDLRLRGKGVSLGEYGVKTHPAWTVANGGSHYHIQRTEEEQRQLFALVAHYALGLGACKVQNWCLRDAQAWVFPWGLFYPNQLIPKDVAYLHRNQSLVWRHVTPVDRPPALAVCLANQLRLGNQAGVGPTVASRTFADLLALHYEFATLDDDHLDALPAAVTTLILPAPLALTDDVFERLSTWVRGGGTLLVTGDLSYDGQRRRTAAARLQELAGVEFVAERYPNIERWRGRDVRAEFSLAGLGPQPVRPCVQVRPVSAEVLGRTADGEPVLVRAVVGRGQVYYFSDPVELDDTAAGQAVRRALYEAFLRAAGLSPLEVEPAAPWLQVMRQPTAEGAVHVVVNTRTGVGEQSVQVASAAGPIHLTVRNGWPALAAVTHDGQVTAVGAQGTAASGDERLMAGTGLKLLLALDGQDVRRTASLLIAPLEPGRIELPPGRGERVAVVGEYRAGRWVTYERVPLDAQRPALDIDADRATCLIRIAAPDAPTSESQIATPQ